MRMVLIHEILRDRDVVFGSLILVNVSEDKCIEGIFVLRGEVGEGLARSSSETDDMFVLCPDVIQS
jgi:hypothetical protein